MDAGSLQYHSIPEYPVGKKLLVLIEGATFHKKEDDGYCPVRALIFDDGTCNNIPCDICEIIPIYSLKHIDVNILKEWGVEKLEPII